MGWKRISLEVLKDYRTLCRLCAPVRGLRRFPSVPWRQGNDKPEDADAKDCIDGLPI